MILESYDNSADARVSIERVAELMPGANATVLTIWEPLRDTLTRTTSFGMGMVGSYAAMGTRGRGGIQAFLLAASRTKSSSTPTAVLVVPSPVLAERRRDRLDQHRTAPA